MVEYAIKTPPHHATWHEFLDVWRVTDECEAYAQAWNFDHFYSLGGDMYPGSGDSHGPCLESWTMLAALAQATTRIRIGCMVNAMHYRHPGVTAKMAATLDIISEGRLDLGLGAGWHVEESAAYGIELGTVTERLDRFEEGVEVIVRLLSQEVTDFDGQYYKITDARCEPKGIQRPHPPVLIGGGGRTRTLSSRRQVGSEVGRRVPVGSRVAGHQRGSRRALRGARTRPFGDLPHCARRLGTRGRPFTTRRRSCSVWRGRRRSSYL